MTGSPPPAAHCAGRAGGAAGLWAKFHSLRAATPPAPANPRGRAGGRICIFVTPALIGRPRGGRRRALTRRLGKGGREGAGRERQRGGCAGPTGARERGEEEEGGARTRAGEGACAGRSVRGRRGGERERANFLPEAPSPHAAAPAGGGSPERGGGRGEAAAEPLKWCV